MRKPLHVGIAAGLALAATVVLWPRAAPPTQFIHVKLAAGEVAAAALPTSARRLFLRSTADLARDQAAAHTVDAPDLSAWWRIEINASEEQARRVASRLRQRADVVTAFLAPKPELASVVRRVPDESCPVSTPSYAPHQGYLGAAPAGIDAAAAWQHAGGRGAGVWFADVEGEWKDNHEDLPGDRIRDVGGSRYRDHHWEAHGTAVVGVVAARDNDIGMVGIVPDVERVLTASIGDIGPAAAIDLAQAQLRPGDVLLIELHSIGPRGRYLPVEFWDDVFDAVQLATARGVIVIAAAGNGGENLDHRAYKRRFDRSFRDSGAILVGAGAPERAGFVDRSRLDFSNYGSAVDAQGWGRKVATLHYGDLQNCAGNERKYTGEFAGTSSASPVVVGAAIALQGIYKQRCGDVLSPAKMRSLLRASGSPQTDGPSGPRGQRIGNRPDLAAAITALGACQ